MSCIKDWPVADRSREKLLQAGPAALGDTELFALILRTGHSSPRTSALDLARQLLHHCGSLRALATATAVELCVLPGIGPAKAANLLAVSELARRLAATPLRHGERFTTSGEVFVPPAVHFGWAAGIDRKACSNAVGTQSAAISFGTDAYPPCNGRPCLKFDQQGFSAMGPGAVYLVDGTQSFALTATRTRALHPVPLGWQPVALT